jgi:hypothetical protein
VSYPYSLFLLFTLSNMVENMGHQNQPVTLEDVTSFVGRHASVAPIRGVGGGKVAPVSDAPRSSGTIEETKDGLAVVFPNHGGCAYINAATFEALRIRIED